MGHIEVCMNLVQMAYRGAIEALDKKVLEAKDSFERARLLVDRYNVESEYNDAIAKCEMMESQGGVSKLWSYQSEQKHHKPVRDYNEWDGFRSLR